MDFTHVIEIWPLLAIVAFLTMLGFMRILTRQIGHQIAVHNTARQAVEMRLEHQRRRQEQLRRQKELQSR